MSLSVCKLVKSGCEVIINSDQKLKYSELIDLYNDIESSADALLLAQLAMCQKRDDGLIVITPGHNKSIDRYCPVEYAMALQLAEKYKVEKKGDQ